MNPIEQLTFENIRELGETAGPCITIVLAGDETGNIAIALKDALKAVRPKLRELGADEEKLLEPIGRESEQRGPVAILRSPSTMRTFRVDRAVAPDIAPMAAVGNHFHLGTLLSIVEAEKQFYILALSQNRTRILKCTQSSSEEVPFAQNVAVSLADAMQTKPPDHVLDNRASGGPSIGAGSVLFGTSTDREAKDEYMLHFFSGLDHGVNAMLKGSREPLVAAGVEHEVALYRRVNSYPHLVEPGVYGAPDGMDGGEMHRRALEVLKQRREIPEDFDKRVGTGHASVHVQEIVEAAFLGRVSQLFFQRGARYMGTFDETRMRVKHTEDPLDAPVDLIESAGWQTILHGGEARVVEGSAMPNGAPACAVFRYAMAVPEQVAG